MINTFELTTRKQLVLDIKKNKNITDQKAQVVLALDYSGSMSGLYTSGVVQKTLERVLPLGLGFDDNGEVDFYLFHDGVRKVNPNITLKNLDNYVSNNVKGQMGGTNYAPCIMEIVKDFAVMKNTGGFMGIGGKKDYAPMDLPIYVIFMTDGENFDHTEAENAIKEASKCGIFFQFVGIGNANFSFLKKLDNLTGRLVDNANFFELNDITTVSDSDLYNRLLNEFPQWLPLAKSNNLIK